MNQNEYQQMFEQESSYWWHLARTNMINMMIKQYIKDENLKIIDIGCGTGILMKELQKYGEVTGVDMSKDALNFCKKRGLKNIYLGTAEKIPAIDESYDLVVALDIVEHTEDDLLVLKEFKRILKKGQKVLITVPAYDFLWGDHDVALHHKRRYTVSGMKKIMEKAGFKVLKKSYFFMTLFPIFALVRLVKKLFPARKNPETTYVKTNKILNNVFVGILKLEAWLMLRISLPVGSSVVILGEKE